VGYKDVGKTIFFRKPDQIQEERRSDPTLSGFFKIFDPIVC